jgi:hypothetical protein
MILHILNLLVPAAMATLTPSVSRGEQIISADGAAEICVIPKKYPGANYSQEDLKMEKFLCGLGNSTPVAMCPKLSSTNPGIQFHLLPNGVSTSQAAANGCTGNDVNMMVAKYKNSISCSYTPSILAYYHVSRILGDVAQVPSAVLRTMNLGHHQQLAAKANAVLRSKAADNLLRQIWSGFTSHLSSPAKSSKKDVLFTDDLRQSYGALQENPRNEVFYKEMFFEGNKVKSRTEMFRDRSPIYRLLGDRRPLRSLVSNQWDARSVQTVVQMDDVVDMILLDAMLSQDDRMGNVHFTPAYYVKRNTDEGLKIQLSKHKEEDALVVKKIMLKDNDCGVNRGGSKTIKAGLLNGIAHINPDTYGRLLKFNAEMQKSEAKNYFQRETMMTASDFHQFEENLEVVVRTLQKACRAGKLQLDLDLNGHFANTPIAQGCELELS